MKYFTLLSLLLLVLTYACISTIQAEWTTYSEQDIPPQEDPQESDHQKSDGGSHHGSTRSPSTEETHGNTSKQDTSRQETYSECKLLCMYCNNNFKLWAEE